MDFPSTYLLYTLDSIQHQKIQQFVNKIIYQNHLKAIFNFIKITFLQVLKESGHRSAQF